MDFKQIQELIKIVNKSNIGELSIEEKDFKITIRQKEDAVSMYSSSSPASVMHHMQPAGVQSIPVTLTATPTPAEQSALKTDNLVAIKSPMIGTFYRSAGPDKPPFASVGDEVIAGKTVCIIEAMKLFNEIESEIKGTIVKVLVEDASPVEYDQPLFLVDPA